jgi:hypothetical protein
MSMQHDYASSPDQIINQLLEWDNEEGWIAVTHSINLSAGKDALGKSVKSYPYGDSNWNNICNQYGLDSTIHGSITVFKYLEVEGPNDSDHVKWFKNDEDPYYLASRPHHVVAEFSGGGGTTSVARGVAL